MNKKLIKTLDQLHKDVNDLYTAYDEGNAEQEDLMLGLAGISMGLLKSIEDMKKNMKKCVVCKGPYEGYGNNAYPLKEGRCCDDCNIKVIVARIKWAMPKISEERLTEIGNGIRKGLDNLEKAGLKPKLTASKMTLLPKGK